MPRFFNTTGPCFEADHYMLPPEARLPGLLPLVEQKQYFVLHAARQTGKSTAMLAFAKRLRRLGYAALYASLETSQGFDDVEHAEALWLEALAWSASFELPDMECPQRRDFDDQAPGSRLQEWLSRWSASAAPRRTVLLLDEVDVVTGPPMVNLLRQLRAGFTQRGASGFPDSIALIGMRDLRDYLSFARDGAPVNPGSPFNIKSKSLTLRLFTEDEVGRLYDQHTEETGQVFTPEATARAFWWSQGQPFLVNSLVRIVTMELAPDPSEPITEAHIDEAKQRLVLERTTHIDSLAERLKEARVARLLQPVLLGDTPYSVDYQHDDFQYAVDLGLLREGLDGAEVTNPLYREVLARQLAYRIERAMGAPKWRWQTDDGRLDFPALVDEFLKWWRENEGAILKHGNKAYPEAVPHLAFMAFLQRVVNGGGTVLREYAAGRGAVDLVVQYGPDRFVVELKRVFVDGKSLERVREDGVKQLAGYLDSLGEGMGWLVIFDQRPGRTWDERLWREERQLDGRRLLLIGA